MLTIAVIGYCDDMLIARVLPAPASEDDWTVELAKGPAMKSTNAPADTWSAGVA